jgi:hypothetical protein
MSTRSIILVTSKTKTVRIYKHCDGYPTGNLPVIADALKNMLGKPCKDVKKLNSMLGIQFDVDSIAKEIMTVAELDASNLEAQYKGPLKPAHLGNQGDLEWIYVVDLSKKSVDVYGGGYTGNGPQGAYKKGTVDPMRYVDCLYPEYRAKEGVLIKQAVEALEKLKFKVNAKKKSKPKGVVAKAAAELGL